MEYSLTEGGQRIRPILALLTAEALDKNPDDVMPLAAAIELIHTYSLIHDDLPCMDDDDFRRGKPSNHKVFGEALAVLAGDALCTEAFFLIANKYSAQPQLAVDLISDLALSAGSRGMVGGQAADVCMKNRPSDLAEVEFLHLYKTGALFKASVLGAARVAGANAAELKSLSDYAQAFGLLFQIADDIADEAKLSKQAAEPSFIKTAGIEKARRICEDLAARCEMALDFFGVKAEGLRHLSRKVYERTK
jgi:geranylgeranyl diphosphate synthase type II